VETVGYKEMAEVHGNRTHPPASSSPAHWFYSYKPSRKIHIWLIFSSSLGSHHPRPYLLQCLSAGNDRGVKQKLLSSLLHYAQSRGGAASGEGFNWFHNIDTWNKQEHVSGQIRTRIMESYEQGNKRMPPYYLLFLALIPIQPGTKMNTLDAYDDAERW
jgi:hypothetical protein